MKRFRSRPRPRQSPGNMNKTEQRYLNEVLVPLQLAGEIIDIKFEGIKLRLAKATFYTPDFVVVTPEFIEMHEVKGYWEDDARVKIKVAAETFPWLRFVAVRIKDNLWHTEEF